ncbi:MAG: AAA family ATPase [Planctomycetia bacterium]|nr:AAA family ATPase [Planctomycetia bacterium]
MPQPLFEAYRPQSWDNVVGQDAALRQIAAVRRRGLAGRAWWIAGASGTGKTTIARLLAAEIADPLNVDEYDAGRLTDKWVEEIERGSHCYRIGEKTGLAITINEAHGLKTPVIRQLEVTLERIPSHVVWIFTTTFKGQLSLFDKTEDASPLLSRCICLTLKATGLELAFAIRAREIAQENCLDGQPLESYIGLAQACRSNMREMLNVVESGALLQT